MGNGTQDERAASVRAALVATKADLVQARQWLRDAERERDAVSVAYRLALKRAVEAARERDALRVRAEAAEAQLVHVMMERDALLPEDEG